MFRRNTNRDDSLTSYNPKKIYLNKGSYIRTLMLQLIPDFTISTNDGSSKFNHHVLRYYSSVISSYMRKNPTNFSFHLDIQDPNDVLSKLEKLFQGECVIFYYNDLQTAKSIRDRLMITECLDFIKIRRPLGQWGRFKTQEDEKMQYQEDKVQISLSQISNIFKKLSDYPFIIETNKKEYKCNPLGVYSSSIIKKYISENPHSNHFKYNFDDEEEEFNFIIQIFDFEEVILTINNAEIIKEIAQDLQIDSIINDIESFIFANENLAKTIDDQQETIENIEQLFHLLYNIKNLTVDFVANSIENSKWSQKVENVYELAAFIIQVSQSKIELHKHLIDLLIKLNEDSENKSNKLSELLPFIMERLMFLFSEILEKEDEINLIFPFVYQMYRFGLLSKERLKDKLTNCSLVNKYFISWFLPELIEMNQKMKDTSLSENRLVINTPYSKTLDLYYPCNSNDEYKQLRDKGEYDYALEKALRNDDVDTFQSIVSQSVNNSLLRETTKEKNIFEPFLKQQMRYINYAAAYGSIKCFKYLLLNNEKLDKLTFEMSIIGGNNELIRIIYNEKDNEIQNNQIINALKQSIKCHQNDIFDWIFENNLSVLKKDDLLSLIIESLSNGNIHSFIQIVDHDFNLNDCQNNFSFFLEKTSKYGFYSLTEFIINLVEQSKIKITSIDSYSIVYSDNIFIFNLFENFMNDKNLERCIYNASKLGLMNIINFYFENIINKKIKLNSENVSAILINCNKCKSNEIIDYLFDTIFKLYNVTVKLLLDVLDNAYENECFESIKKATEYIYKNNKDNDFTGLFSKAAKLNLLEIVQFFIDKKYSINFDELRNEIPSYKLDIFLCIINNLEQESKSRIIDCIDDAIKSQNKPLVKYLLTQNISFENALIEAVKLNDNEIFDLILKKNKEPSYINKKYQKETALIAAIENRNWLFFNALLSTPGIDPNISFANKTPLILLAQELNVEYFDSLLKFYGDDIKNQTWQLERAIKAIFDKDNDISHNDPNCGNMYQILLKIVELNCVNLNYRTRSNTLLTFACKINKLNLVKALIQKDSIDVNLNISQMGNTPLIIAIKNGFYSIVKLLVNHPKININQKNYEGKTPLICAVEINNIKIIELLIKNDKFDKDESMLNHAFYISRNKIAETLLSLESLDVNYVPTDDSLNTLYKRFNGQQFERTPLINSIIANEQKTFDLIISHPSFKNDKSLLINAIYVSLCESKSFYFLKLIEFANIDINSSLFGENSILVQAVIEQSYISMIESIINHPNFDSKKSNIYDAFIKLNTNSISIFRSDIMVLLFNYDLKHDHIIDNHLKEDGQLILANVFNVNYVLKKQKNLSFSSYEFKQAIEDGKDLLSLSIISMNKVDLNQHVYKKYKFGEQRDENDFTTFLHIAVKFNRTRIIDEILSKHLCDINITNGYGETPLMEACKSQNIECVKFLFTFDDLDFQKKNNKGEDALSMIKNMSMPNTNDDNNDNETKLIVNKDQYLSELLKALDYFHNNPKPVEKLSEKPKTKDPLFAQKFSNNGNWKKGFKK